MEWEHQRIMSGTYDAVLSLDWLLSCPDRQRDLAEIRRILKRGGQIAVAAYGARDHNAFLTVPIGIMRRAAFAGPPAGDHPDPFLPGESGALAEALREAGFIDVKVRVVHAPLRLPSAAECARFVREIFGAFHSPLANRPPDEQSAVWDEIALVLRQFESNRVFVAPCELLVGIGTK